jgi:hypothetical protein
MQEAERQAELVDAKRAEKRRQLAEEAEKKKKQDKLKEYQKQQAKEAEERRVLAERKRQAAKAKAEAEAKLLAEAKATGKVTVAVNGGATVQIPANDQSQFGFGEFHIRELQVRCSICKQKRSANTALTNGITHVCKTCTEKALLHDLSKKMYGYAYLSDETAAFINNMIPSRSGGGASQSAGQSAAPSCV